MRTTVDLPDELLRRAKARAAMEGRKLKDLIAEYVDQGLRRTAGGSEGPRRVRSVLPIAQEATGVSLPLHTNAELYSILNEEDASDLLDGSS